MAGTVVLLDVVGWAVLVLVVAPQRLAVGDAGVFGVGLGITAFLLGVRHAVDADHIAAIDNTTAGSSARAGATVDDVVQWTVLIVDGVDLGAAYGAIAAELAADEPALVTTARVAGLGVPGALVEISAVAAVLR